MSYVCLYFLVYVYKYFYAKISRQTSQDLLLANLVQDARRMLRCCFYLDSMEYRHIPRIMVVQQADSLLVVCSSFYRVWLYLQFCSSLISTVIYLTTCSYTTKRWYQTYCMVKCMLNHPLLFMHLNLFA